MSTTRILIADDEPTILYALEITLQARGYEVVTAADGREALVQFDKYHPSVLILDMMMPRIDGLAVIQNIRAESETPIIVLSVQGRERTKVAALDAGADDYITKPFTVDELLARIRAALRRSTGRTGGDRLASGDLELDVQSHLVTLRAQELHLTPLEYELLKTLMSNAGKVLTHQFLLSRVWHAERGSDPHYLHVYVAQLRRKIELEPDSPRFILTEPGVGYRFSTD